MKASDKIKEKARKTPARTHFAHAGGYIDAILEYLDENQPLMEEIRDKLAKKSNKE